MGRKIKVTESQMDVLKRSLGSYYPGTPDSLAFDLFENHICDDIDRAKPTPSVLNSLSLRELAAMLWFPHEVELIPDDYMDQLRKLTSDEEVNFDSDLLFFDGIPIALRIRAKSDRYLLALRSLPNDQQLYSVLDFQDEVCGTLDTPMPPRPQRNEIRAIMESLENGSIKFVPDATPRIKDVVDINRTLQRAWAGKLVERLGTKEDGTDAE